MPSNFVASSGLRTSPRIAGIAGIVRGLRHINPSDSVKWAYNHCYVPSDRTAGRREAMSGSGGQPPVTEPQEEEDTGFLRFDDDLFSGNNRDDDGTYPTRSRDSTIPDLQEIAAVHGQSVDLCCRYG
jgi:hypothetical protein